MRIAGFSNNALVDRIMPALERDGVVIIRRIVPDPLMNRLEKDNATPLNRRKPEEGKIFGYRTKRLAGVIGRSNAFAEMIAAPTLMAIATRVLSPNCLNFQMQLSSLLQVCKGGELQPLHRDVGVYHPYVKCGPKDPEILVSLIWAGTDFTAQLGGTLHGMGINTTERPRLGVISGYCVGWLRQEENQYLACPPAKARKLPANVQHLLGYRTHGTVLGWVDGRNADNLLKKGDRDQKVDDYENQPLQG